MKYQTADYDQKDYDILTFVRPFRNTPVPEWLGAIFIGLFAYIVFLVLAALSDNTRSILSSAMHIMQIDFSFAMIFGLITVLVVDSKFKQAFFSSESYFDTTHEEYQNFVKRVVNKTNSLGGFAISIPLMIMSTLNALLAVGPNIPDDMFPVGAGSIVFVYFGVIEFSIWCVFLVASVGFWFAWCMIKALKDLRKSFVLELPALPTRRLMSEFSDLILTYTVLLTLIIGSVFPVLMAIVLHHSDKQINVLLGSMGLGITLLITSVMFVAPQFQLHNILVDAKTRIIEGLSVEYASNEKKILEKMRLMKDERVTRERMQDIEALVSASSYLVDRMLFVQSNVKEWSFDVTAVLTVVTSSLIPLLSFLYQVVGSFFRP